MAAQRQLEPLGTVLVTGGCGFLGSHIVAQLLEHYAAPATTVHVLDLHTARNTHAGATYHAADLTAADAVHNVLAAVRPAVVIHTASPVVFGDHHSARARDTMRAVNVDGTATLLAQAAGAGCVRAFVYTSSASVLSDMRSDLLNADERWTVIAGPAQKEFYTQTKAEAERLVLAASTRSPPDAPFLTCALRPSAIFGEHDVQQFPPMLKAARNRLTGHQLGANDNLWDFTYAGNVAHAHLLAARRLLAAAADLAALRPLAGADPAADEDNPADPRASRVDGEAFLITNAQPVYFWDFARAVWTAYANAGGAPPPAPANKVRALPRGLMVAVATVLAFVCGLLRLGDPNLKPSVVRFACMTRYFRTRKAERRLGYAPVWSLEEGVERTVKWFRAQELAGEAKKTS